MYLTVSLILAGCEVVCPKPGPDVGIIYKGQRIWFEATSLTCGAPDSPNYIAPPTLGQVFDVPQEKIILRYLNSISEKYERQYVNWLKKGIVSNKDAFVIALNPRGIPFDFADAVPPRILQAGYTLGALYIVVDRQTAKAVGSGYHFRDAITKASGAKVTTGVFQREDYAGLSALLCSRVDAANRPGEMGGDFQLAPNPHANVPLPDGFRLRGVYYDVKVAKDGYDITPV